MWESTRMLFGMTGAPATFHRNMSIMMEEVLEKYREFVQWFFDDIIIGTKRDDRTEQRGFVVIHSIRDVSILCYKM